VWSVSRACERSQIVRGNPLPGWLRGARALLRAARMGTAAPVSAPTAGHPLRSIELRRRKALLGRNGPSARDEDPPVVFLGGGKAWVRFFRSTPVHSLALLSCPWHALHTREKTPIYPDRRGPPLPQPSP
jgi:hypothetical protein